VTGVDNQFYRAVGCVNRYQPGGSGNLFAIEMLAGSWGVLIILDGVTDISQDGEVEVSIYANGDSSPPPGSDQRSFGHRSG